MLRDGVVLVSGLASVNYERETAKLEEAEHKEEEVFDLLDGLVGTNGENISLATLPAANHPNVRLIKHYFSASGEEVSSKYVQALRKPGRRIRQAAGAIRLRKEDTAVVIGSRLANTFAERYLGSAYRPPDARQIISDARGSRVRPKWTFYSDPSAPSVEVVQWGKSWRSRNNILVNCMSKQTYHVPERLHGESGKKYRERDYLLINGLPRYAAGDPQRVVIFEGLHRNGTRAAGLICSQHPLHLLRKLATGVGANPYYQALFKVNILVDAHGEAHPVSVDLCDDPYPLKFA